MNDPVDEEDARFFMQHPDRQSHIREPKMMLAKNTQRAVGYVPESEREFNSLSGHKKERRRMLLWRIPPDNRFYDPNKPGILKIPFLLFADETVEDRDDILLPIIHQIMLDAQKAVR